MTAIGWAQLALYLGVLLALVKPLGGFMAKVYAGERTFLTPVVGPLERLLYRAAGVSPEREQGWQAYAFAFLTFNFFGLVAVYLLQRLQGALPLNPQALPATTPDLAFNTAVSFASNTNWQSYGGETTLSYLTQMLGLTVQNFVSAAAGMAVLVALARGIARRQAGEVGNFWVDMTRSTLYVLVPLSLVGALVLVSQGVVQTFGAYPSAHFADAVADAENKPVLEQLVAVGPAASQIIIKQLGTNGGGFFNVNSAHPLENPTPLSNFVECLSILLIPAALTYTFGKMVGDARQGWALLSAMVAIFVPLLLLCTFAELAPNPQLAALGGIDQLAGNMEGKEARFGVVSSALWATATTAASNGSVNAMHDSFTPLGGLVPMGLMQLGEVVFGGVGSGLYGMFMFAVVAVFVAGLMVGRTPEYAGKKIEAHEMKMASLVILVPAAAVLVGTATACATAAGQKGTLNPGAHGFSEILYAFSSAANNNGSAFGGLSANTPFYNTALGLCMLFGRFWVAVPVLALAGSLAKKKFVPPSAGTLPTHTPLFVSLVVGTVVLVGALTFLPALALGPVVEHLQLHAAGGSLPP
jgi:potassium-transporting ATPase potassium-binding subunit